MTGYRFMRVYKNTTSLAVWRHPLSIIFASYLSQEPRNVKSHVNKAVHDEMEIILAAPSNVCNMRHSGDPFGTSLDSCRDVHITGKKPFPFCEDNTAVFQIGSDMSAIQDLQGKFTGRFSGSTLKNSKPEICLRDYGIDALGEIKFGVKDDPKISDCI
ncbi:hypothetical protein AVEN_165529-1 [Araneus ventricosus]|uniref:Uncharacterized protein n=1 Tax=Araneus ventricosus TaxID=182803 RepID=A0A4Y2N9X3_ARAVE|nr:hypothetical protein AVEN_165529-1 [Araneus ventricosus]